jgi:phosphatidate phosphatase LPIN
MTADNGLPRLANAHTFSGETIHEVKTPDFSAGPSRSSSPPPPGKEQARHRAIALSKKLWTSNIPSQVNGAGDLMLDITGYKSSEEDSLRAELVARQILTEELEGDYDIGSLIGADENGNLWIYSSEEARDEAARRAAYPVLSPAAMVSSDALSDPGYQSDGSQGLSSIERRNNLDRRESDSAIGLTTPPDSPTGARLLPTESLKNYAKTLRLTSDQLKSLGLKSGPNPISFTVNRATCQAYMYLWKHDVPIVISDIDGTITKSDALGHVLNMIGRDWTHLGVAKLYTDISNNGYNIFYLTSRAVGQADTTRNYLSSIVQEGYKLPRGPVIMSPDRTIAALRREIYLRKPEVFKMACLRDIKNLFASRTSPFYAGFGNRLTDALSYRSVNIPSTRIFTINANAEVSLDLLSLSKYKTGYVTMRETVDHFFPPVGMLVHEGGEDFTDFNYWRDTPRDLADFSPTESDDEGPQRRNQHHDSDEEDDEAAEDEILSEDNMEASYMSRDSVDESFLPRPSIDGHLAAAVRNDEPYDDDSDEADLPDTEEGSRDVEGPLSEPSSPNAARKGTGMLRSSLQNLANAFQATGLDGS